MVYLLKICQLKVSINREMENGIWFDLRNSFLQDQVNDVDVHEGFDELTDEIFIEFI
jgi:hypothetical protein